MEPPILKEGSSFAHQTQFSRWGANVCTLISSETTIEAQVKSSEGGTLPYKLIANGHRLPAEAASRRVFYVHRLITIATAISSPIRTFHFEPAIWCQIEHSQLLRFLASMIWWVWLLPAQTPWLPPLRWFRLACRSQQVQKQQ